MISPTHSLYLVQYLFIHVLCCANLIDGLYESMIIFYNYLNVMNLTAYSMEALKKLKTGCHPQPIE